MLLLLLLGNILYPLEEQFLSFILQNITQKKYVILLECTIYHIYPAANRDPNKASAIKNETTGHILTSKK